jgi:DNA-binding transcriptional regulator YdaS (Cro superfamily)
MMVRMSDLRAQALARAALIVGGLDKLSERLGFTPATLAMLIRGDAPVPPEMFMRATEIITDATVEDASNGGESKNQHVKDDPAST